MVKAMEKHADCESVREEGKPQNARSQAEAFLGAEWYNANH